MNLPAVASLPMYDWPEVRWHTDRLWQIIRTVLQEHQLPAPATLERHTDTEQCWIDKQLVFSQTCGLPYATGLRFAVVLLGTPVYSVHGSAEGHYKSLLFARSNEQRSQLADFEGSTLVINGEKSQSGYNAVRLALHRQKLPAAFFRQMTISGSHRESLLKVVAGSADVCAIDPVSWALFTAFEKKAANSLRQIGESPFVPSLPFIAARSQLGNVDVNALSLSLQQALETLPPMLRNALHISGLALLTDTDYRQIRLLTSRAEGAGYASITQT